MHRTTALCDVEPKQELVRALTCGSHPLGTLIHYEASS